MDHKRASARRRAIWADQASKPAINRCAKALDTPRSKPIANAATTHSASHAATTCDCAQLLINWSAVTTSAATPAASITEANVWVEVVDLEIAGMPAAGNWPKSGLVAVFILYSLIMVLIYLAIQNNKTIGGNHRVFTNVLPLYLHDAFHS
jgi:hypothetical protein